MADIETLLENEWHELLEAAEPGAGPLALPAEGRVPLSAVSLLAQLEEVREAWRDLRSEIAPGDAERFVNAGWTLKDLIAHVASWAKEFRHEVETVRRGGDLDYVIPYAMHVFGPNAWNEEQVRARSTQSLDRSFDEIDDETVKLQNLLLEMSERDLYAPATFPLAPSGDPEARWSGPSAAIIAAKCIHDRHHLGQLQKRLASWR